MHGLPREALIFLFEKEECVRLLVYNKTNLFIGYHESIYVRCPNL